MTIVAPWGVWQCADHRLVWIERGKATEREDVSVKHLAIRCPDGVALISYSGLGALDRKLHVSDWMRELVRGDNRRTVDGTLIRIREAATMDLARPAKAHGVVHWFVAGVFLQRRPWWAVITNQPGGPGSPILDHFETIAEPADNPPRRLVAGKGMEAISAEDWALLDRIKMRQPRRPEDYARVLAGIHRRAQQSRHPAAPRDQRGLRHRLPAAHRRRLQGGHWPAGDAALAYSRVRGAAAAGAVRVVRHRHDRVGEGAHPADAGHAGGPAAERRGGQPAPRRGPPALH
jgi:hypothetical protein